MYIFHLLLLQIFFTLGYNYPYMQQDYNHLYSSLQLRPPPPAPHPVVAPPLRDHHSYYDIRHSALPSASMLSTSSSPILQNRKLFVNEINGDEHRKGEKNIKIPDEYGEKCNNLILRNIMEESMIDDVVSAKISISQRASKQLSAHFDVVCSTGILSYLAAARVYCQLAKPTMTCFAFRHDSSNGAVILPKESIHSFVSSPIKFHIKSIQSTQSTENIQSQIDKFFAEEDMVNENL